MAKLGGRKVVLSGGDFTVRGGSGGGGGGLGNELSSNERARQWKLPLVRLLDAAGGSVRGFEDIGRTYLPDGNGWSQIDVDLLSKIPVVSAVMGSVAGLPAINACLAHFNVMVKDTSQLFPGGPPVVKAALGYDITKEDLGGPHIHTRVSGCVDNLADTEADAFAMIRDFLSYLPSNVWEMAPRQATDDDPERREESLVDLMPRDRRKVYKVHALIDAVLDKGSFFEIAPRYGRSRVTGLGRLNGYPVGIMANNPRHYGGSTDVAGGSKVMRLLQLCDVFHLPIVSLADEPGFMVGLESEEARYRARRRATRGGHLPVPHAVDHDRHRPAVRCRRTVPSPPHGDVPPLRLALGKLGVDAHRRRRVRSVSTRDRQRAGSTSEARGDRGEAQRHRFAFRTAEATGQDIIDPRETRSVLCEFAEDAQRVLRTQTGEPPIPYRP